MSAIDVHNLVAGHGGVPAVRGLSLHVDAGEVVLVLGPSGAGKSTTLLTIAGVLPRLGGQIVVLDAEVPARRPHLVARRGLALVPENRGLFRQLSVGENLRLSRRRGASALEPEEVLDVFPQLRPLLERRAGLLSGGEQQMLALAKAITANPAALLIDELSLGLAPLVVESLLPTVRRLAKAHNMAILLVEQHARLALAHADRAYVLNHGEMVLSGTTRELAERNGDLESSYLGFGGEHSASP